MKKFLLILSLSMFSVMFFSTLAQEKTLLGNWKYEVSSAPYGYESGSIIFSKVKDTLHGVVVFENGDKVNLDKLTLKNDTVRAKAYVEGESVSIIVNINKNNMTGKVDTSMGALSLKAEKSKSQSRK